MRALVPFEIAAIGAVALAPLPAEIPVALPLVVVAALSIWIRGRAFADTEGSTPSHALIGLVVGLGSLAVAVVLGTPLVESVVDRAVQWSTFPIARGSVTQAVVVMLVVATTAVATELALRGWVVARALELRVPPIGAVAIGALAEAMITRGDVAARLGAALFGAGLGWMYVAGKRTVGGEAGVIIAPLVARLAFTVGAVVLEALRVIG